MRPGAPLWRLESITEDQPSLQHFTNQALMVEWPDSPSSLKGTGQPPGSLPKKLPNDSQTIRSKLLWSDDTKIGLFEIRHCIRHKHCAALRMLQLGHSIETILHEYLVQSAQYLRWGKQFTFLSPTQSIPSRKHWSGFRTTF